MVEELTHQQYKELGSAIEENLKERYFMLSKSAFFMALILSILSLGAISVATSYLAVNQKWNELNTDNAFKESLGKIEAAANWYREVEKGVLEVNRIRIVNGAIRRGEIYYETTPGYEGSYIQLYDSKGDRRFLISALETGRVIVQKFKKSPEDESEILIDK